MRHSNNVKAIIASVLICTLAVTTFAACSDVRGTESTGMSQSASGTTSIDLTESVTEKDLETQYNETESVTVTLNGDSATADSSLVDIDGSVITVKSKGTYVFTGTLDDGYIVVDAGKSDDIRIVLKDAHITSSDFAALYCISADNVYVTLEDGTDNQLINGGEFDFKDDNNVDGAIFSKTDITINGTGSLEIISTDHGIAGKDDVTITGGVISVSSTGDGIQANDSVVIQDCSIDISCGKDGIQSDNGEDPSKGYICVVSGKISITAGDDGLTASSALQIDGGTLNISESYEGLEGQNITINGGSITINSSDDAINAVSSASGEAMQDDKMSTLTINGGDIEIRTGGDGVDSNGTFEMNGGTLIVMGPTIGGNGFLDVNGSASINGGTVIMAGASGMAENFTSASQGSILLTCKSQSEGSEIKVTDGSGNEILTYTADCSYQALLISSPDIGSGNTYTVYAGDYSETVTLTDNIYGSSQGFGPGNYGNGGFPDGFGG